MTQINEQLAIVKADEETWDFRRRCAERLRVCVWSERT